MSKRHLATTAGLATAGLLLLAGPAAAHISPTVRSAPAGGYLTFALQVPHGCGDGGTNKLEVQIPDGITSVTPGVVPGWTVTRTLAAVTPPIDDGKGGTITERTSVITWSGGPLAHDQLEQFPLSVKTPDTPGATLAFPVIQSCDNGERTDWIQVAVDGEEEPEHPAPAIDLTASAGDEHGDAGDDEEDATSVTVADDDSDALGISGTVLGGAGVVLGGAALLRSRKRA